ncbi:2Fe-2S iron-sulfur cluster binding domain-containing protein [Azotobacter beijerinckii]|uniref:2Fe-2S iron-sulfur cluster binding domain-containing protein n=1 Tax=Azotobacter beijerinckii TaxID=170623 RepID=A0A1H9FGT4_9GAMM|nr:2Fe-2S iron-sulfur cluster binding domain-containing protein [Azotobacter beijerinckii]SEQ36528.1 2Fe-2S iron-sulfur cluster binding domain-containing protein [Azotobacter beijerinckii]
MKHEIHIEDTGERYACDEQETVLNGMARLGRKGIPVGCRGGGCGVCKVRVTGGSYTQTRTMSRQHVSADEQEHGTVLACCIQAQSSLSLKVVGKLQKAVCKGPIPLILVATETPLNRMSI